MKSKKKDAEKPTTVVVMSENRSVRLSGEQVSIRMKACESLDRYVVDGKEVVVLASPEPTGLRYATTIAERFGAMMDTCDGLKENVADSMKCIEAYQTSQFCLVIAIVANKIEEKLAWSVSEKVGRLPAKSHFLGMGNMHIIE